MASFELKNTKQLMRLLKTVDSKIAKKIMRQAVRAGSKLILDEVRATVPRDTGALRKALKIKTFRSRKAIRMLVGSAEKDFTGKHYYGSFIEYGTSKMPAKPYLRPAFDRKENAAAMAITEKVRSGLSGVLS